MASTPETRTFTLEGLAVPAHRWSDGGAWHIDTADVAKVIRVLLKRVYPGVVFSVKIKRYAGGSSIDIRWTDGPTTAMVDVHTKYYQGKGPMDNTDYSPDVARELEGERVYFSSSYVFCERDFSVRFLEARAKAEARRWGMAVPEVTVSKYGRAEIMGTERVNPDDFDTLADLIYRRARKTATTVVPE